MSGRRLSGLAAAVAMLGFGALLAAGGLGWSGQDTSESWAMVGSILAGLGVALGWVMIRPPE